MTKRVALSYETKRNVFRLLVDASMARHLARECAVLGTVIGSMRADYYRAENRRFLRQARLLVDRDFTASLKAKTAETLLQLRKDFPQLKEGRNAPVQVSEAPAFRRLSLLCVLGNGAAGISSRLVQPLQCLPRLRAPWAPLSGQWPLVLPAPLCLRPVQAQAPTLAQLDRCVRYRRADSLCANPRAFRTGVTARPGSSRVSSA